MWEGGGKDISNKRRLKEKKRQIKSVQELNLNAVNRIDSIMDQ
jgi:hypothetical protein